MCVWCLAWNGVEGVLIQNARMANKYSLKYCSMTEHRYSNIKQTYFLPDDEENDNDYYKTRSPVIRFIACDIMIKLSELRIDGRCLGR